MINMWPKTFLENDLESAWIFLCYAFEYSFIFEEIHTTGRVYHFSSDFECDYGCMDQFFLESRYCFYIFDMPMFGRIGPLVESPFTTTGSIEQDTIESLWSFGEVLAWVECHSDIRTSHTIEVLEELGDTFTGGLIGDDK